MCLIFLWNTLPSYQKRQPVVLARILLSGSLLPLAGTLFGVACIVTNRGPFSGLFFGGVTNIIATATLVLVSLESIYQYRRNDIAGASRMAAAIKRNTATQPEENPVAFTERMATKKHRHSLQKTLRLVFKMNAPILWFLLPCSYTSSGYFAPSSWHAASLVGLRL
jgi:hypothetical protein